VLRIVPIHKLSTFGDGETIDVPGRPRVVHAPGHTEVRDVSTQVRHVHRMGRDPKGDVMLARGAARTFGVIVLLALGTIVMTAPTVTAGGCTIQGTPNDDRLRGTGGTDVICGGGGDDIIRGLVGDDVLRGGTGNDTLQGGRGDDRQLGGGGSDFLDPGAGSDVTRGGRGADFSGVTSAGNDRWVGGAGSDHLTDFTGIDSVFGGGGNDLCLATADNSGGDTLVGGVGNDIGEGDANDDVRGIETVQTCFAD
jgi:Ca2+-binding RTX toxin-like protein